MKVHRPNKMMTERVIFDLHFPSSARGNDRRTASKQNKEKDLEQALIGTCFINLIMLCAGFLF